MIKIFFFIWTTLLSLLSANDTFVKNDSISIKLLPLSETALRIDDKMNFINGNYFNMSYLQSTNISDIGIGGEIVFGNDKEDTSHKYYYVGFLINKQFDAIGSNLFKPYISGGIGFSHFTMNSLYGQKINKELENRYGFLVFSVDAGLNIELFKKQHHTLLLNFGVKGLGNYLTVDNRKKVQLADNSTHEIVYEGFHGGYFGLEYKF